MSAVVEGTEQAGRELDCAVCEAFGATGRMIVYEWYDRKQRKFPRAVFAQDWNNRLLDSSYTTFVNEAGEKVERGIGIPKELSTSIADAWLVVEKMDAEHGHWDGQHVSWTLERSPGHSEDADGEAHPMFRQPGNVGGWNASFYTAGYDWISARADTAPLAICKAALLAIAASRPTPPERQP